MKLMNRVMTGVCSAMLVLALCGQAWAEECSSDEDCADGMICEMMGVDCPPSCDPDDPDCEPVDCEPSTEGYCAFPNGSECLTDEHCPDGFICEVVGGWATSPCMCPPEEPDCGCDEEEPTSGDYYGCVPKPCESDADCGEGLSCFQWEYEECNDIAIGMAPCPEGDVECEEAQAEMEEGGEPDCETVTETMCVPEWLRTCESDDQCDENFQCLDPAPCSCDAEGDDPIGIDTTDEATGDDASSAEGEDEGGEDGEGEQVDEGDEGDGCDCEPEMLLCLPQQIPCEADDQCPSDWSCFIEDREPPVAIGEGSGSSGGAPEPSPDPDGASSDDDDGDDATDEPADDDEGEDEGEDGDEPDEGDEETGGFCMPPGFESLFGLGGMDFEGSFDESAASGTEGPEDTSEPVDPDPDPGTGDGEGTGDDNGDGTNAANGTGDQAGTGDGVGEGTAPTEPTEPTTVPKTDDGCSVATLPLGSFVSLGLVMLALIGLRRRAQGCA